jgi:hypothetical protein
MLIKCIICGNSEKPLYQFPSDSGELNRLRFFGKFVVLEKKFVNIV